MDDITGDWGDMVMPGVYMIQRHNPAASAAVANANSELGIDYEQLYLEAEEIQEHIDRLTRSNEEIMRYLNDIQNGPSTEAGAEEEDQGFDGMRDIQGMQDVQGASEMVRTDDGEGLETDLDIFRDALQENEGVIASKKRRLTEILKALASNKCGCQFHKHGEATQGPTAATETEPAAPADRFSL